jgi:hypothetical protein
MNDLANQIRNLSREEALEAAQHLGLRISGSRQPGEREKELLQEITNHPNANIEEIEQLCRLLLFTAAMTDGYEDAVKAAIAGAGRKQFILGGAEIVALAAIGLVALHIVVTRGKSAEDEVMNVTEENGKTVVSIQRKTTYGISDSLGKILKSYFPGTP